LSAVKEPFLDLYTGDWMKDQAVSRCAPATRGIWLDLLCGMHDDSRSGELCGTADVLARLARCSAAELVLALTDLQITGAADVTERHGTFTVRNRRMFRKAQEREAARLRQSKHRSNLASGNNPVTPSSRDGPYMKCDSDIDLSFSGELPSNLDAPEFRKALASWIAYKSERRDTYKPAGLAAMISRAEKLAALHGVQAVIDAMERAAGNRWAGWDQPNSFPANGKSTSKSRQGAGQSHDPDAAKKDPNHGRM
jgi:hypothetical protein